MDFMKSIGAIRDVSIIDQKTIQVCLYKMIDVARFVRLTTCIRFEEGEQPLIVPVARILIGLADSNNGTFSREIETVRLHKKMSFTPPTRASSIEFYDEEDPDKKRVFSLK